MGLNDEGILVVVYRQTFVHGVSECFSIVRCRPQLEYVVFIVHQVLIVDDKLGETFCHSLHSTLFADILNRIQQELEGRKALLAVYDFAPVYVPGCRINLLNDDGAKEVAYSILLSNNPLAVFLIELL